MPQNRFQTLYSFRVAIGIILIAFAFIAALPSPLFFPLLFAAPLGALLLQSKLGITRSEFTQRTQIRRKVMMRKPRLAVMAIMLALLFPAALSLCAYFAWGFALQNTVILFMGCSSLGTGAGQLRFENALKQEANAVFD